MSFAEGAFWFCFGAVAMRGLQLLALAAIEWWLARATKGGGW